MKRAMVSGKFEEVIYARLEAGEDLLPALWDICKQNNVKTGILLNATGNMSKLRLMRISNEPRKDNWGVDFVEIPGPLQMTMTGLIGVGWVPDEALRTPPPEFSRHYADTGFGSAGFDGHEDPYFKVNITAMGVSGTAVCGHLLQGSPIGSVNWNGGAAVPSHFTVAIAKVSGCILRATYDKTGYYHELVPA
ncbi:PCC domain-containing protein [Bradyrhizobium sp. CCBAU 51627]|uniref:PCC domain-containing protein n=1 Tax=Bradyrhizobium sp. CCBAU 51627 TaxID=1325088 RepID=UPI00230635F8|nr:DUF296 domain-containing protein [Bradyrhizobium sp. CCBAU 51627]MDA9436937.1 hypothetical protein [Bradyrhizobium sp. CCBAU 51627]